MAAQFECPVRDPFVGVHIGRSARTALDRVDRLYLDERASILDEIAHARPKRVRAAMEQHIQQSEAMLLDFLRGRGFEE